MSWRLFIRENSDLRLSVEWDGDVAKERRGHHGLVYGNYIKALLEQCFEFGFIMALSRYIISCMIFYESRNLTAHYMPFDRDNSTCTEFARATLRMPHRATIAIVTR